MRRGAKGMKKAINHLDTVHWLTPTPITTQFEFLKRHYIYKTGKVLVLGCGNGSKSMYLENQGFSVTSIDSSKHNTLQFKDTTGRNCFIMPYDNIAIDDLFDIIWVDDALIYENRSKIHTIFEHLINYINDDGYIYCSFKFGKDYYEHSKIYTCFTLIDFKEFMENSSLKIVDCLITPDERPKEENGWLHVILKKK